MSYVVMSFFYFLLQAVCILVVQRSKMILVDCIILM
jgi:hypothetical protein